MVPPDASVISAASARETGSWRQMAASPTRATARGRACLQPASKRLGRSDSGPASASDTRSWGLSIATSRRRPKVPLCQVERQCRATVALLARPTRRRPPASGHDHRSGSATSHRAGYRCWGLSIATPRRRPRVPLCQVERQCRATVALLARPTRRRRPASGHDHRSGTATSHRVAVAVERSRASRPLQLGVPPPHESKSFDPRRRLPPFSPRGLSI